MNSPKTHFIILYPSSPSSQADTAVPPSTVSGIVSVAAQSRVAGTISIANSALAEPASLVTVRLNTVRVKSSEGIPEITPVVSFT